MAKFLNDTPIFKDAFLTHSKISEKIYSTINKNPALNRKVIALFGSWGIGKSSVIKMLKEKILLPNDNNTEDKSKNNRNSITFIEFNTWANKGNLLKRNFLYKIAQETNKLESDYPSPQSSIKYKDIISGKIKKQTINRGNLSSNKRAIIYFIIMLIISLFLTKNIWTNILYGCFLPKTIKNDIFQNDIKNTKYQDIFKRYYIYDNSSDNYKIGRKILSNENKKIFKIFQVIKYKCFNCYYILLSFCPMILVVIIFMIVYCCIYHHTNNKKKKDNCITHLVEKVLSLFFPFIGMKKITLNESITSVEHGDLTIYDFIEIFKCLIDDDKKVIIVFDNLDRVDDKTVLEFLSNLELFIEQNLKNVWYIIPIDNKKLSKILSTAYQGINSQYFIEKIFTIKFYISSIYNKNWQKYFEDKFKEAFNDSNEKELHKYIFEIINIFKKGRNRELTSLSPREIINYINEMVSIYLLNNTIDIRTIALFATYRSYYNE